MSLDLRKLDQLIAVAEEGSFTRAAARLHLSQQALSTSIRALEREVGVPLLERESSGISVLPSGQALIEDARVLDGIVGAAVRRARRIGRGETEPLRIGHTPAVTGEEIAMLLRARVTEQTMRHTEVSQGYPVPLLERLRETELDLVLCRGMSAPHGLTRGTLTEQRLSLAVSAEHHLAERAFVELSELAGEHILVWGKPGESGYTDLLLEHCRRAGFEPVYSRSPMQGTPPVTAVIGTREVAFVTAPPGPAAGGWTRVIELRPAIHTPLHAIWSPHTTNEARDDLLGITG